MDYYFIGIKGTGMASLACIMHDLGNQVSGSDLEKHFFTEESLKDRNITVLPFDENNIHSNMNIIIGNAFLDDLLHVMLLLIYEFYLSNFCSLFHLKSFYL